MVYAVSAWIENIIELLDIQLRYVYKDLDLLHHLKVRHYTCQTLHKY